MSDLGDYSHPLPSYPTLPGSMDHQYASLTEVVSDPTLDLAGNAPRPPTLTSGHSQALDPSLRLRLATPDELGYSAGPTSSARNSSPQLQYQPQMRRNDSSAPHSLDLLGSHNPSSLPDSVDNTGSYYSLPPSCDSSLPSVFSNTPIYATVRKQPHTSTPLSLSSSTLASSPSVRQRTVSGSPFPGTAASGGLDFSVNQSPLIQSSATNSVLESDSTLPVRAKHFEALCGKMSREKSEMAEEFGRQRKSFMNQMAHSDAQLTLCKQRVEKYSKEVQELSKQLMAKDEELQNVTIAAGITEATLRERFDVDRVKYEEEIASLTKIVSVQTHEGNQAVQQERETWQRENATLRAELEQFKRGGLVAASSPVSVVGRSSPLDQHVKSASPNSDDDDLEMSMIKAAEDTKLLRSVVVPLEEEIRSLKARLSEADSRLEETNLKLAEQSAVTARMTLIDLDPSKLEANLTSPMSSDPKELQSQLTLARSACHDLEMHTSQLKMQKTILQEEAKSLSEQLASVSTDLEVERLNCSELKKTWELANAHFVVAQDQLKQEIYRLHQKLERGDAASPLREISIEDLPAPTIIERPHEAAKHELRPPRTHKRSFSSDEAAETSVTPTLHRLKSASWTSLHKPSESSLDEKAVLSSQAQALEDELSKTKAALMQQQQVCSSYEKQLQRVQEQMMADIEEKEAVIEKIKMENEKYKAHIMRQRQQYEKLCRQMDEQKEEMRTRIETFQNVEQELKNQLRILKDKFTELKHDTQREIARMSEDRRDLYQQIHRSKEEYDYLKTIQNSSVMDYQAQLADLKQTHEETLLTLNRTTSELGLKKDQVVQVRDMLAAERSGKEKLNAKFVAQLEAARKRIEELSPLASKFETEKAAREEAVTAKSVTEQKSRDFIKEQRDLIERLDREKSRAETQVQELQRQVASLKHKLNHTEETQKDFVELSQSLQMKLAVMEEEIQRNQELQVSLPSPPT